MIDFQHLSEILTRKGLIQKSFFDCTLDEIKDVVTAVFSSVGDGVPADGWDPPRIEDGHLIIPFDCHPKYRWWSPDNSERKSLRVTLKELNAPYEVACKYVYENHQPITREAWEK